MEQELLKIFVQMLSKQHGMSASEVNKILFSPSAEDKEKLDLSKINPNAVKELLAKDATRVTEIKDGVDLTEVKKTAKAEAKKEVLGEAEKKLAAKYKIKYVEGETKLDNLVTEIVANSTPAGKELTDDIIKKHPTYLALETAHSSKVKQLTDDHTATIESLKGEHSAKSQLIDVKKLGGKFLNDLKPILSKTAAVADNQRNDFLNKLDAYQYQKEGNDFILIDPKTNKRLEDEHGRAVKLSDKVNELATVSFDFQKQDKKGNAGNGGDGSGDGSVTIPTDEADYNKAMAEANTVEDREKIHNAWEASKAD